MQTGLVHCWQQQHYRGNAQLWKQAFTFLASMPDTIADGRYSIAGDDVYAAVATYIPKCFTDSRYEQHTCYADIQYVFSGSEWLYVTPEFIDIPSRAYDTEKDIRFFALDEVGLWEPSRVALYPGSFAVVYPEDIHMPAVAMEHSAMDSHVQRVRKVVVKVRVVFG